MLSCVLISGPIYTHLRSTAIALRDLDTRTYREKLSLPEEGSRSLWYLFKSRCASGGSNVGTKC